MASRPPAPPPPRDVATSRRPLPPPPPEHDSAPTSPMSAGATQPSLIREGHATVQRDSMYMTLLSNIDAIHFVEMVHVVRSFDGIYCDGEGLFADQILSVRGGDIMLVLERMDENFLRVKRFSDGATGIVHRNNVFVDNGVESMNWFHGPLSAIDASSLLKSRGVQDGAFLLRNSSQDASSYSLSIRHSGCDNGVLHYRVLNNTDGFVLLQGKSFKHLFQLIAFYQFPDSVRSSTLKQHLTMPLTRTGPLPLRRIPATEIDFGGPVVVRKDNVLLGCWKKTELAIKTWHPTKGSIQDFEAFGNQLLEIQNLNVIKFLGVCEYPPNKYIVFEYVSKGSLETLLKSTNIVQATPLLKIGQGVCNGMAFLESKGIIHRNLKASNVVINDLSADNKTVRIIGFTKAQRADLNGQCPYDGATFAVRWSAPEIISKIIGGSHKTDVWAFGIVMTEIFSIGERPYNGMDNNAVKAALQTDYRMERPARMDDNTWRTVVFPAWSKAPLRRPTFSRMQDFFDDYLGQEDGNDYDQLVNHYA